jgi:hypothetical protein
MTTLPIRYALVGAIGVSAPLWWQASVAELGIGLPLLFGAMPSTHVSLWLVPTLSFLLGLGAGVLVALLLPFRITSALFVLFLATLLGALMLGFPIVLASVSALPGGFALAAGVLVGALMARPNRSIQPTANASAN